MENYLKDSHKEFEKMDFLRKWAKSCSCMLVTATQEEGTWFLFISRRQHGDQTFTDASYICVCSGNINTFFSVKRHLEFKHAF